MTCIVLDLPTGRLSTVDEADAVEAYPDLLADTLFAVVGTDIVPPLHGRRGCGHLALQDRDPARAAGYAWLRVNGPFDDDVTVRTYADGTLLTRWCSRRGTRCGCRPGSSRAGRSRSRARARSRRLRLASTAAELR